MATTDTAQLGQQAGGTWLGRWTPEDASFWELAGKVRAWRTLAITTANLTLAFIVWFVVSALVVRLPGVGFNLTSSELFWLTAMPGLAGGTLRIVHTFLVPLYGTRHVVSISTLLLLIPLLGWFFAVQDPTTPYWVLMVLAFLAGLGGGNFSSFMPSTSLFFPKRLQGTALAIQAGVGNFGVSIVQFVTPWIIGFALAGSLLGTPESFTSNGVISSVWLQNATAIYVPLVVVFCILAWIMLRSIPVHANFREQLDIFTEKHGLFMTFLYIGTFGTFSGLAATFPLLIKQIYGPLPGAPDPLAYAFLGPLIGSAARVLGGPLADRLGGARVTQWSFLGMIVECYRPDLLHGANVDGRVSLLHGGGAQPVLLLRRRQRLDLQADAHDLPAAPSGRGDRLDRRHGGLRPVRSRADARLRQ